MNPILRDFNLVFSPRGTPGLLELGDKLTATFTEPLVAAVPPTTTVPVTLDQQPAAPSARINIPGLTNGYVSIHSGLYFSAPGTANWTATVLRSGDSKIVVTLISDCYGAGCADLLDGPPVTMPMDLDNTIMDAVGNIAFDPPALNFQWF
jgi:hypothetical protein